MPMRAPNRLIVSVSLLFLFTVSCAARPVRPWLPEELEPRADLICNGTVISVEDTGIKMNSSYPNVSPPSLPEMVVLAKIKVLHVFKGKAPAVIEFRCRVLQPKTEIGDGPEHVDLGKGLRYRFFLKPDKTGDGYVGVLDGNIDDNYAVEFLCPNESDDSPYLQKDEAIKLALDYLHAKIPGETFEPSRTRVNCNPEGSGGASWCVMFSNTADARSNYSYVTVRGDHTIDEKYSVMDKTPQ